MENPGAIDWTLLPRALLGLLALLCGNGYIVGINQIYDVDIDVVNKPFLPVAAGELSPGGLILNSYTLVDCAITSSQGGLVIGRAVTWRLGFAGGVVSNINPAPDGTAHAWFSGFTRIGQRTKPYDGRCIAT